MHEAQRPHAQKLTQVNTLGGVIISGNEIDNGSVRLVTRTVGNTVKAKLEVRDDQVWNGGEMEVGESSVFLGPNMSLSALGTSLELNSLSGNIRSISLDIPISDEGTEAPRTIRAEAVAIRVIGQSITSLDQAATEFRIPVNTEFQGFVLKIYFKVGSVRAEEDVTMRVYAGTEEIAENLIHERTYPASRFPANTEVILEDSIDLGTFVDDDVLGILDSSVAFSLLGDPDSTVWFAVDIQEYVYEEVISTPTGTDKFLVNTVASFLATKSGDLLLGTRTRLINGIVPA